MKKTVYEIITERILELLEQGVVPWRKPWTGDDAPINLQSNKEYRGCNVFMLHAAPYASPYWVTYKQAKAKGGCVRKGEKGWPVIFWKWLEKPDADKPGEVKRIPFLRYYTVFNVEQCDGVDYPKPEAANRKTFDIPAADGIAQGYKAGPAIMHQEAWAYYRPATDTVNMPQRVSFNGDAQYYATLFHELAHSTGHKSRLDRKGIMDFAAHGTQTYSQEELVAEMGAAFLCGEAGILNHVVDNSAAYINGWMRRLRSNPKWLVIAAAQAQKAADHILGRKFEKAGE